MKRNTLYIVLIILSWAQITCAQEGTLKWKYKTIDEILSSVATDSSGNVYIGNISSVLYVLSSSGNLQWYIQNVTTAPVIAPNGTIYVGQNQSLQAYNPDSTLEWSTTVYTVQYSSANGIALGLDSTIYVGSDLDSTLRAFTPQGTQKLEIILDESLSGLAINRKHGIIYAASYSSVSSSLYAINSNGTIFWKISDTTGFF